MLFADQLVGMGSTCGDCVEAVDAPADVVLDAALLQIVYSIRASRVEEMRC
jgi:hypothetical protein